jgi:hypothetical protein
MRANLFLLALSGTIVLTGILLTPLLRTEPSLKNPLVDLSVTEEAQRGDLVLQGAPTISGTLTEAPKPGTYILSDIVTVPGGTTVEIPRDVHILAARDAALRVQGTLKIDGGTWGSNQRHDVERQWHGIIVENGGHLIAQDVTVSDATSAISCARGGHGNIRKTRLYGNVVGVTVLPDSTCVIEHTTIERGDVGIQIVGGQPDIRDVMFDHLTDGIRIYGDARPTLFQLSFIHITQYLLLTRGAEDIVVYGLTALGDERALSERLFDREDQPSQTTQEGERPIGRLSVVSTAF